MIEKLFWVLSISVVSCAIWSLSDDYLTGLRENPITTSVSLVPVDSVAFPAVVVNAGEELDRMAVLRGRAGAGLAVDDFDNESELSQYL